ncbi:hypothetical protein RQP46_010987 [Phenoliferia psychrophenolica]
MSGDGHPEHLLALSHLRNNQAIDAYAVSPVAKTFWTGWMDLVDVSFATNRSTGEIYVDPEVGIELFDECLVAGSVSPLLRLSRTLFRTDGKPLKNSRGLTDASSAGSEGGDDDAGLSAADKVLGANAKEAAAQAAHSLLPNSRPVSPTPVQQSAPTEDSLNALLSKQLNAAARRRGEGEEDEYEPSEFEGSGHVALEAHEAAVEAFISGRHDDAMTTLTGIALDSYLRAVVFRGTDKKLLRDLALSRVGHPLPVDARLSILRGEYTSLSLINGFDAETAAAVALAESVPGLFVDAPSKSLAVKTAMAWSNAFRVLADYRAFYYPFERMMLDTYHSWVIALFTEWPTFEKNIIALDEHLRKRLGLPGCPRTLADAPNSISLQLKFLNPSWSSVEKSSSGSTSSANGPRTASAKKSKKPKELCDRWNDGVDIGHSFLQGNEASLPDDYRLAGTSTIPRLRRTLHFPSTTIPATPATTATLTAPPLPRPPLSVTSNAKLLAALAARPDLFAVSTPLHIPQLRLLLKPHPNRPLIDSVLLGLEEGFWPGHDGSFKETSHLSGPALRQSDEDLDFLADYAQSDFEKGYLSKPFDQLEPGMHLSPSFVVRPDLGRPRGVCDQSSSGLNDGVTREVAKVRYDTSTELAALARYRKRRGDLDRPQITPVWWRSDVSGGFRNLPVSVFWQIKQIHRIRLRLRNDRYEWVYFVDQRLILGGRMSPKIFCTVMNVILWATQYRFALEFPLAFVDDAFGLDVTGVRTLVTEPRSGETRLVPSEQARILLMWNLVHLPWDWKKQIWDPEDIIILGHLFRMSDLSIFLSSAAIEAFAEHVERFLSQPHQPLIEWQRIAGYAQWACSILPFARFALQCLYLKMAGKTQRRRPVPLNKEVRRNLAWFVNELRTAPPLHILDPALEHWRMHDADVVIYTDACLVSDDGTTSGLGFWVKINGEKRHFYHRTSTPLTNIQYAEALAIFSAIIWAADNVPNCRRILVFTDSSLGVYGFDSGRVQDDILDLVWTTYRYLGERGIDLRVRHIPGKLNSTADFLSRALIKLLPRRPRQKLPHLSLPNLRSLTSSLILTSLEPSTRRGCSYAVRHWTTFTLTYSLPDLPNAETLPLFVAFLSRRVKHPNKILSALSKRFSTVNSDWESIRFLPAVVQALAGAAKLPHAPTKRSPPGLPSHLASLVHLALAPNASYALLLAAVVAMVAFAAVMRLGECVAAPKPEDRDPRKVGEHLSRSSFLVHLRAVAPNVTGHGLRAGGATYLAQRGVSSKVIQRLGRWNSDSWEIYIRQHPALAAALQAQALTRPPAL